MGLVYALCKSIYITFFDPTYKYVQTDHCTWISITQPDIDSQMPLATLLDTAISFRSESCFSWLLDWPGEFVPEDLVLTYFCCLLTVKYTKTI